MPSTSKKRPTQQVDTLEQKRLRTEKLNKLADAHGITPLPDTLEQVQVQPASSSVPVPMSTLPGTAQGQGGSGDGNAPPTPIYKAMKPFTAYGSKYNTYRKVHRLMSFGLAHTWIEKTVGTAKQTWLSTFLAEIPWHMPFFYLNPSEFNLLPKGSKVKEMRIKIIHRGNRIAFETSASTTQLATLNQIQNIGVAHGLNKTGWGVDVYYDAFNSTQKMIPTSLAEPVYTDYITSWYGYDQTSADFTKEIPDHQIGYKSLIRNYFAMPTIMSNAAITGGTPCIAKAIQFYDGKTTINQTVGEFVWKPVFAPIKQPLQSVRFGLPEIGTTGISIDVQNNLISNNRAQITTTGVNNSAQLNYIKNLSASDFTLTTPIEKSDLLKTGPWGHMTDQEIQPTVHVGIQPIPALTSTDVTTTSRNYTDAQADFEIYAEIDIEEYSPNAFPHAIEGNVPPGDIVYAVNNGLSETFACTYAGRRPTTKIALA